MKKLFLCVLVFSVFACGSQQVVEKAVDKKINVAVPAIKGGTYYLVLPKDRNLIFSGQNKEKTSSTSGSNQIGMGGDALVSMIGAISQSSKVKKQRALAKEQAQKESDELISSYRSIIDTLSLDNVVDQDFYDLAKDSVDVFYLEGMSNSFSDGNVWKLEIFPQYKLSNNEKSILIISTVKISESVDRLSAGVAGGTFPSSYSKEIIVESFPVEDKTIWIEDSNYLELTLKKLLLASVELAYKDFSGTLLPKGKATTIRYKRNDIKKVERGFLKSNGECRYILFESLTGKLKLLPSANSSELLCEVDNTHSAVII